MGSVMVVYAESLPGPIPPSSDEAGTGLYGRIVAAAAYTNVTLPKTSRI